MKNESKTDWQRVDALNDEQIAAAIAADPDAAPELSDEQFKQAKPSPEVVEHFRAQGKGWQSRINEVLAEYVTASG